jgi:acetylornithine deacetylase/succinyl-diaminopimelate desuccinylase-like protein
VTDASEGEGNDRLTFFAPKGGCEQALKFDQVNPRRRVTAKAVHTTYPGVPLAPHMEVGASDAAVFRANGIPTYGVQGIFVKLSEDYTHGLNERVPVPALRYGLTHWYVLLKEVSTRH